VVVASEDSLQSVTKDFTMFLLLIVCVVGVVLEFKTLCRKSCVCIARSTVEVCDQGSIWFAKRKMKLVL
jgi:hypothetical protein